jgi:hypothetical protein
MGSSQSAPEKPPSPHLRPGENELEKNDTNNNSNNSPYPKPTGHEYDAFDKIASEVSFSIITAIILKKVQTAYIKMLLE